MQDIVTNTHQDLVRIPRQFLVEHLSLFKDTGLLMCLVKHWDIMAIQGENHDGTN